MTELAKLRIDHRDAVALAAIAGEVDMSNAGELRTSIAEAVPNTTLAVVVDLTATTYLDSAGVRIIFQLSRELERRQQELRLVVPESSPLVRVLRVSGVPAVAPLHMSVGEAIAAIDARRAGHDSSL